MNSKIVSIVAISCVLASGQLCHASANNKTSGLSRRAGTVQIYLLREVTIKDNTPSLGEVSIIRGKESLVAKASEIPLGRISVPGQEIIVDRSMVLSRLACNGIPASKVTLTGAEKITVRQQQHIITGKEFVERARSFLKKNLPVSSVGELNPVRIPKDLVVPTASKDIKFSVRLAQYGARNQAKVQIAVLENDKEVGVREVTFRLRYNRRRVVTLVDIPAGVAISPANVKTEEILSNYPEPADWSPPYGFVARRRLPANTVIRPNMVGPAKSALIVGRNQSVVIQIERPGLMVTAVGKTLQEGRAGEYIKVRNVDSQRIILARVNDNGTVQPVF